jgi:cytochrome P450
MGKEYVALKELMTSFTDPLEFAPVTRHLPLPKRKVRQLAAETIQKLLKKAYDQAQQSKGAEAHTILDHMVEMTKNSDGSEPIMSATEVKKIILTLETLHNLFLFFIAGQDTTGNLFI